jgi:FtsX-like permease family
MHPLQQQIDVNYDRQRAVADLSTLFGGLAILLASIGLYDVMACAVARRTVEIGLRMAVGATRGNVVLMVLRSAFAQVTSISRKASRLSINQRHHALVITRTRNRLG